MIKKLSHFLPFFPFIIANLWKTRFILPFPEPINQKFRYIDPALITSQTLSTSSKISLLCVCSYLPVFIFSPISLFSIFFPLFCIRFFKFLFCITFFSLHLHNFFFFFVFFLYFFSLFLLCIINIAFTCFCLLYICNISFLTFFLLFLEFPLSSYFFSISRVLGIFFLCSIPLSCLYILTNSVFNSSFYFLNLF